INVTPVNDPPVAADDTFSVNEGESISGNIITHNDGDGIVDTDGGDGATLTVTQINGTDLVFDPITGVATVTIDDGTLVISADGSFTYTHNGDEPGTPPSFTYTLSDGTDVDTGNVTINVTPVNDPPIAADDTFSVDEGSTVSGNIITHNDGDGIVDTDGGDGATLTVTQINGADLVFDPITGVATVTIDDGTLVISADGSFTYTHNGDEPGTPPSFTYTLSDGTDVDTGNVTINVMAVPAAEDDIFNINEGDSVTGNVITHNDGDGIVDTDGGDGSSLFVTQVNGVNLVFGIDGYANITVDGGILSINADGDFTYQNSEGFVLGADYPSFEYTLSDGAETDTATVSISINDSAPIAIDDTNSVVYSNRNGFAGRKAIKGNVLVGGSSGDNEDTSPDGPLTITQFEYDGQVYVFDASNTSYTINTGFGFFVMNNTGEYSYSLPTGTPINAIPPSIAIIYTIEDGDVVNPETDTATLTISFSSTNTTNAASTSSDGELIDIFYNEEASALSSNDEYINPAMGYDLSDLLVASSNENLDESMLNNLLSENGAISPDQQTEVVSSTVVDTLTLENTEQTEVVPSVETIVTNGFLDKGVMLVSDESSEVVPLPIELDSTDHL
ncbi:MAG: Ig-like domain-containing protein, partial [Cognaticolwellia sp.]